MKVLDKAGDGMEAKRNGNRSEIAHGDHLGVQGSGMPEARIASLREEMQERDNLTSLANLLNAAGNETRIRILYLLWRNAEVRVNDIAEILDLTTPAISQQLKKLRAQRLVKTRRDAQTIYYRLNKDVDLVNYVTRMFLDGELLPVA